MRVSKDNLAFITGRPAAVFSDDFADALSDVLYEYDINTPLRAAHFLAQVCHESGGFRYPEEIWGPTPAQERYEGRADLGNVQEGDGYRFRGRGYIQLTGRANYAEYGEDVGVDFLSDPDELTELPWSLDVCAWFWDKRGINDLADDDDVVAVTKRINGGTNGLEDRKRYLQYAKAVFMMADAKPDELDVIDEPDEAPAPGDDGVRTTDLPEVYLTDGKPFWARKRVMGWAIATLGAFGANVEYLKPLLGSYDDIILLIGILVNLYGTHVAKQHIRLWPKKKG